MPEMKIPAFEQRIELHRLGKFGQGRARALLGGFAGLVTALVLVILSPAVWVNVLGNAQAIYPYDHPALFSMPLAFLVIVVVSKLDRSPRAERERAAFDDQFVRAQTGLGAATAVSH